jgi:hypothetical protein
MSAVAVYVAKQTNKQFAAAAAASAAAAAAAAAAAIGGCCRWTLEGALYRRFADIRTEFLDKSKFQFSELLKQKTPQAAQPLKFLRSCEIISQPPKCCTPEPSPSFKLKG